MSYILLTDPKLPKHLTADEVTAVLDYAARYGTRETVAQAVLNELRQDAIDVKIAEKALENIDTSDIPEVGEDWFKRAKLVLPAPKPEA